VAVGVDQSDPPVGGVVDAGGDVAAGIDLGDGPPQRVVDGRGDVTFGVNGMLTFMVCSV
jgi:hypothetical protein